jgi:hypothetical protein
MHCETKWWVVVVFCWERHSSAYLGAVFNAGHGHLGVVAHLSAILLRDFTVEARIAHDTTIHAIFEASDRADGAASVGSAKQTGKYDVILRPSRRR